MNYRLFAFAASVIVGMVGIAQAEQGVYYQDVPYVIVEQTPGVMSFGTIFVRPGINSSINTLPFQNQSGLAWAERYVDGPYSVQYQAILAPAPNGGAASRPTCSMLPTYAVQAVPTPSTRPFPASRVRPSAPSGTRLARPWPDMPRPD